jgi:type III secretory pathway component EscS
MNYERIKAQRRPLIDPLLLILKSRRVIVALAALLVGVLVSYVPALANVQGELMMLVIALALAIIGGYSIEDAALIALERKPTDNTLREVVKAVIEEMADGEPTQER